MQKYHKNFKKPTSLRDSKLQKLSKFLFAMTNKKYVRINKPTVVCYSVIVSLLFKYMVVIRDAASDFYYFYIAPSYGTNQPRERSCWYLKQFC